MSDNVIRTPRRTVVSCLCTVAPFALTAAIRMGGGRSAAVLYSVVGTCRRLGLDPYRYLQEAFGRIPGLPAGQLDEFLPDRGAAGGRGKTA